MIVHAYASAASTVVTLSIAPAGAIADEWITLYDPRRDLRAGIEEDNLAASLARRPVIRDQGPPPVHRERAPRRMHPPARRLSWLVEGRRP